jgi:peptidoglycan hydrolase CwlO-like protein
MKRLALLIVLLSSPAYAQTPPPDPRLEAAHQLLTEANGRVMNMAAQVSALQAQVQALTKQIEDAKTKDEKTKSEGAAPTK